MSCKFGPKTCALVTGAHRTWPNTHSKYFLVSFSAPALCLPLPPHSSPTSPSCVIGLCSQLVGVYGPLWEADVGHGPSSRRKEAHSHRILPTNSGNLWNPLEPIPDPSGSLWAQGWEAQEASLTPSASGALSWWHLPLSELVPRGPSPLTQAQPDSIPPLSQVCACTPLFFLWMLVPLSPESFCHQGALCPWLQLHARPSVPPPTPIIPSHHQPLPLWGQLRMLLGLGRTLVEQKLLTSSSLPSRGGTVKFSTAAQGRDSSWCWECLEERAPEHGGRRQAGVL